VRFVKGHGTGNDFVLLPDPEDRLRLDAAQVAALCDRRTGIGADGLLRVVRRGADGWFMDYRNADGSVAEMCGNGVRVYARYLVHAGLAEPGRLLLGTRAGEREVIVPADPAADITVDMGPPALGGDPATVLLDGRAHPATPVSMGNPHAVALVGSLADLDLTRAPTVTPATAFPDGVNVELVELVGPAHLRMRVHERGVGETSSCGTGACAAAVAARSWLGDAQAPEEWLVDLPGGRLRVQVQADRVLLSGPAVLVAEGELLS